MKNLVFSPHRSFKAIYNDGFLLQRLYEPYTIPPFHPLPVNKVNYQISPLALMLSGGWGVGSWGSMSLAIELCSLSRQ